MPPPAAWRSAVAATEAEAVGGRAAARARGYARGPQTVARRGRVGQAERHLAERPASHPANPRLAASQQPPFPTAKFTYKAFRPEGGDSASL
eukprot:NODE_26905_length_533_cov_1.839901.p1 GENE.NODE_26905_length_533_cov_1.839901~~NODE_26905_length_533_cov_1.839901.p1  ORF type:complete len:92 (-),score=5.37 NODE_26905_length_533_cov_1.839901:36-311(-)